ncbi:MAG: SDR family NAD(P)-dependent oxidoreductase, partial [Bacteroidetes bacterium]|nr:SDR family NAD(P)-dependent oxidoreductase [Bacteroidota bacterium]
MPTVVVTGASQGIGRALAETFAQEPDARLALAARSKDKLRAVAEACRAQEAETLVVPTDVTDPETVEQLADTVADAWGPPDVLINNAGAFTYAPLDELTLDGFREQIDVNLTGTFT